MESLVIDTRYLGVARSDGETFSAGEQASCLRPTYLYRQLLSGMSELFVPAEFAAMIMALVAVVLGALFAFPETFRLRSPGSRVACLRLLVGSILAVDATLQFLPGAPPQVAYLLVVGAGQEQPALSWWFSYWAGVIAADPGFWWYGTGTLMALLAACMILGVARRLAYVVGFLFSLMLWSVPNGFGGPFDAPSTDIGAGLLYAVLFLSLLQMDSVSGPARLAGDPALERRWPAWRIIGGASFRRLPPDDSHEARGAGLPPSLGSPPSAHPSLTSLRPRRWQWLRSVRRTDDRPSMPARRRRRLGTEHGTPASQQAGVPTPSHYSVGGSDE